MQAHLLMYTPNVASPSTHRCTVATALVEMESDYITSAYFRRAIANRAMAYEEQDAYASPVKGSEDEEEEDEDEDDDDDDDDSTGMQWGAMSAHVGGLFVSFVHHA